MIIQFKIFEKVTNKDLTMDKYVVLDFYESDVTEAPPQLVNYVQSNVGKIVNTIKSGGEVVVRFDNVVNNLLNLAREFNKYGITADGKYLYVKSVEANEIKYIGDNKEELEIKLNADKYNL